MKYLIILLLFSTSCKKEYFKPDFSNGKITVIMNDENWEGKARGLKHFDEKGIDMYFDKFNSDGILRQRLEFNKIPIEQGIFPLFNTFSQSPDTLSGTFFNTIASDGDVIEDNYIVIEDETISNIEILSYDANSKWLRGRFQATFYLNPNRTKSNPNNPDTFKFEMGEFEVKIEE